MYTRDLVTSQGPSLSGDRSDQPPNGVEDCPGLELALVGKLFSDKPFNKAGIRVVIYRAWHFIKNLEMEEVQGDRFIFLFPSVECRVRILDQAPWSIKGFHLLLKPWSQGETVFKVEFSVFPIWIQVHGLPMGKNTR